MKLKADFRHSWIRYSVIILYDLEVDGLQIHAIQCSFIFSIQTRGPLLGPTAETESWHEHKQS